MIVLFVSDNIYHLVNGIVAETQFGCAYVLGHVHGGAVTAEQQLVVKSGISEVCPYRTVVLAVHYAFFKTFKHFFLAFKIGLAFVIDFIEIHTHPAVGFVKTGIYP